jgi:hypothetical protein
VKDMRFLFQCKGLSKSATTTMVKEEEKSFNQYPAAAAYYCTLHQDMLVKLWTKQAIKNVSGVKDISLVDQEESLQQYHHYKGGKNWN